MILVPATLFVCYIRIDCGRNLWFDYFPSYMAELVATTKYYPAFCFPMTSVMRGSTANLEDHIQGQTFSCYGQG